MHADIHAGAGTLERQAGRQAGSRQAGRHKMCGEKQVRVSVLKFTEFYIILEQNIHLKNNLTKS
jgi:hypothetical protein